MRIHKLEGFRRISIDPGEYYVASGAVTISTLLGSCVAACLYDPIRKVIGMNHFLLSSCKYDRGDNLEAGRYGIHAMELLINGMMAAGADRRCLKAKAFGGASLYPNRPGQDSNFMNVGNVNSKFIREFLAAENIPLVSESLGGPSGRVIHFSNGEFTVFMRRINASRSTRVAERDHECWLQAIESQKKTIANVDLWL